MKSIVFLALVAAAVAHWPYADQEDKFRVSGLSLLGSSLALDPTFHWIFSPLNNQLLPTFQMRFPHAPLATSNSKSGLVYTIVLDHLAEVTPSSGTFTLVPGSTVNLNEVIWFTDTFTRFYDDESMGEVIEFVLQAYDADLLDDALGEDFDETTATEDKLAVYETDTKQLPIGIRVRLFPDSADDLVDIAVIIMNYNFVEVATVSGVSIPTAHLALFWKIAASTGDEPARNVPLSLDYDAMTFEVDGDVKFKPCLGSRRRNTLRKVNNHTKAHAPVIANARTMKRLGVAARDVSPFAKDLHSVDHTTAQLWLSGGYVATVFGVVPDDLLHCIDVQATSTIAVRTFRAKPE